MICHEYGWTIDQVFSCTRNQIDNLVNSSIKRMEAEKKFHAAIHGAKLRKDSENTIDLDKDFNKLKNIGIDVVEE